MGYFNNSQTSILGLTNLNTGNQLKAGDKTELRYRLTDANHDVLNLHERSADIYLKQGGVQSLLTTTTVNDNMEVAFTIDTVLPPGSYQLEVVVDNRFFPSDNSENIVIYPSYLSLIQGALDDVGGENVQQLKAYVKNLVENGLAAFVDHDTTYVAGENVTIDADNVISAIDKELWDEVAKKQNQLTPGENISIDAAGTISAVDNDTVYDDTALKELVFGKQDKLEAGANITIDEGVISTTDTVYDDAALRSVVAGKQDKLLAGENIFLEADGLIHAVDTNTVYDDTALRNVVDQKQGRLTAGENITLSGNTISAHDTIYDDSAVRTRLGSIQQILDEMVTGEISFQEFIDRLSTLETDMQLVKAKTANLSANITSLQTIIDNIEDVNLTEVNQALDSINQEIDQLRDDLVDTTLEGQVSELQATVNGLIATVNDLIANGGDAGTIDPDALTDLQAQVDSLADNVSVIATEYSIRELVARVEDVETLTYHFEGTSQDVIDFIDDRSVRALRFHSIANLVDHATRTYGGRSMNSRNYGQYIDEFLAGSYNADYDKTVPGVLTSSTAVFNYEQPTLHELGLLDRTIAIRVNPSFGVLTEEGQFVNNETYMVVVLEGLINPDTGLTYTRQFTLGNTEIVDGQFNIYINPETTKLRIALGTLSGNMGLLPGKFVSDDTFIGIWKIDETVEEEPNDPEDFTIAPVDIPSGTALEEAVELVKEGLTYDGNKTIVDIIPVAGTAPSFDSPGEGTLDVTVVFDDDSSIVLTVPITIVVVEGTAPSDDRLFVDYMHGAAQVEGSSSLEIPSIRLYVNDQLPQPVTVTKQDLIDALTQAETTSGDHPAWVDHKQLIEAMGDGTTFSITTEEGEKLIAKGNIVDERLDPTVVQGEVTIFLAIEGTPPYSYRG